MTMDWEARRRRFSMITQAEIWGSALYCCFCLAGVLWTVEYKGAFADLLLRDCKRASGPACGGGETEESSAANNATVMDGKQIIGEEGEGRATSKGEEGKEQGRPSSSSGGGGSGVGMGVYGVGVVGAGL